MCEAVSKVTDFGDLVEIVDCVEWQEQCSDSCFFFENGRIYPHDKPIDSNDMVLPQHVGFYRWERDREEADLLYQSFPTFDYLLLPVPIECTIREPNAEEELWMNRPCLAIIAHGHWDWYGPLGGDWRRTTSAGT